MNILEEKAVLKKFPSKIIAVAVPNQRLGVRRRRFRPPIERFVANPITLEFPRERGNCVKLAAQSDPINRPF